MIKEIFLTCALALPRATNPIYREYEMLEEIARGRTIVLEKGVHKIPENSVRLPFRWRGFTIYLVGSA